MTNHRLSLTQVLVEWLLSVAFTWILAEPLLIILMTVSPFVAGDFFAKACTRIAEIRPRYVKILAVRMPPYPSADPPTGHRRRPRRSGVRVLPLLLRDPRRRRRLLGLALPLSIGDHSPNDPAGPRLLGRGQESTRTTDRPAEMILVQYLRILADLPP